MHISLIMSHSLVTTIDKKIIMEGGRSPNRPLLCHQRGIDTPYVRSWGSPTNSDICHDPENIYIYIKGKPCMNTISN